MQSPEAERKKIFHVWSIHPLTWFYSLRLKINIKEKMKIKA